MRRERRKRYVYGALLCVGMNLLAGCKEKTVDYNIEGATESAQKENSESNIAGRGKNGVKQFADEPAWNSSFTDGWSAVNAKGEEITLGVYNAEIAVPDAEEMYVVEVKEPEFDAAYKKQLAERIFEAEEVYYNDLVHLPKKDIEEQREQCQALYQLAGESKRIGYDKVRYFKKQYQFDPEDVEGWREILEQELLRYDNALEMAGSIYTPVGEYDVDEYLGTYSGIAYELSFLESDRVRKIDEGPYLSDEKCEHGCFMNCRGKEIVFRAKDIYQVCPEEVKEAEGLYYRGMGLLMENQCSLSEKEAKELAWQFADELKLDYSVYTGCETLGWWKGTDLGSADWRVNYLADGYIFYFEAGVDSTSFMQFGTQETIWNFRKMKKDSEEPQYYLKAQMEVYVTDKGVIGMRAYNPVETVSISEGVDLLPLDSVKETIKEQVTSHYEDFRFNDPGLSYNGEKYIQFDRMELIYFRVRDKGSAGYYSYIPVWRLSEGLVAHPHPEYFENQVLINAIDGSMIQFYDEA